MEKYKKILVPYDGSKLSRLAFEKALSLAKLIDGEVSVIHIIEPYVSGSIKLHAFEIINSVEIIERKTKDAMEIQFKELVELGWEINIKVHTVLKKGNISDEIINESSEYDLIIMGSLGETALERLFLGSVAEKVSRHACCPVMLVREHMKNCGDEEKKSRKDKLSKKIKEGMDLDSDLNLSRDLK
jgi:nucleotide-binding universal stress UspA family protein